LIRMASQILVYITECKKIIDFKKRNIKVIISKQCTTHLTVNQEIIEIFILYSFVLSFENL